MKRAANLSVDADLLDEAKALKINLSKTLEEALRRDVARLRGEQWKVENREAIQSYNSYVKKHGLPLAKYRKF